MKSYNLENLLGSSIIYVNEDGTLKTASFYYDFEFEVDVLKDTSARALSDYVHCAITTVPQVLFIEGFSDGVLSDDDVRVMQNSKMKIKGARGLLGSVKGDNLPSGCKNFVMANLPQSVLKYLTRLDVSIRTTKPDTVGFLDVVGHDDTETLTGNFFFIGLTFSGADNPKTCDTCASNLRFFMEAVKELSGCVFYDSRDFTPSDDYVVNKGNGTTAVSLELNRYNCPVYDMPDELNIVSLTQLIVKNFNVVLRGTGASKITLHSPHGEMYSEDLPELTDDVLF